MFLLNLPVNAREQAAIERRRREEKERLSRIFNVKYRTIGIDKTALDVQVKERAQMKEFEQQRQDAFDRQTIRHDSKWIFLDQEKTHEEHQHAQELNAYRRLHQRPENAREWDLNDPNQWKSQSPARISDHDPRLGPSSGQIFAGEDLRAPLRKKAQQEQMRNALHLQNQAKMAKDEQERFANRLHDCQQMKLFEESVKFEEMENECRRAIDIVSREYNEILARETRMRAHEWKRRQTEEQLAELGNMCFSDMLTENVPEQQLEGRRRRIIVDQWKGMTKAQLDEIHRVQKTQIDERQKMISEQKQFDNAWGKYANAVAKQGTLIEQQTEVDHRQHCQNLAEENRQLAQVHSAHHDYLNSIVYESTPNAAFYEQFSTTSR